MDHTSDMEQEIIGDSEGEEELTPLKILPVPVLKVHNSPLRLLRKSPALENTSAVSEYSHDAAHKDTISNFSETPARPAKARPAPRPKATTKPARFSDSIQPTFSTTSSDDFLNIADRAKMRGRAATQQKRGSDIIEISDDEEDELSMPSPAPKEAISSSSRPRPKPKPLPRRPSASAALTSANPTADPSPPILQHPTIAAIHEPDSSFELSSPAPATKRKPRAAVQDDDVPPPRLSASETGPEPAKKAKRKRNTDDDDFGEGDVVPTKPRKSRAKDKAPAAPKKVKVAKPKEPEAFKSRELIEDDEDPDDFLMDAAESSSKEPPRPKAKPKGKEKGSGSKRPAAADDGDFDELFHDSAPARSAKPKPKAARTPKPKALEVFKSADFVADDDTVDDLIHHPTSPEPTAGGPGNATTATDELSPVSVLERAPSPVAPVVNSTKAKAKPPRKRKGAVSDDDVPTPTTKKQKPDPPASKKGKGKAKVVLSDDEEDELEAPLDPPQRESPPPPPSPKENINPDPIPSPKASSSTPTPAKSSLTSRYSIAPRTKSTPMSELIRRVNSHPSSPFPTPRAQPVSRGTAYSPYMKSSKSALSRIAPLHPNRKPPPPPLPPPPPRQKTKKEKEMEEQWEEELIESVGGMNEWLAMEDGERKEMRRAKREREMGGWED